MKNKTWPVSGFARGADWNPDQWPKEVWMRDIQLMVEAGVNLVTLPVFGWASLELAEAEFDFAWLDEIIGELHLAGIRVNLATATATPPAWMVRKYPDILPVDASGVRLEYGSRQSYCLSSKNFRAGAHRLTAAMANHYKNHPALAIWHISNEYGDHVSRCYCSNCSTSFRNWLMAKYQKIENLNDSWGAKMWGQSYSNFSQIEPPRQTMAPGNPSQYLDFARFSTECINELYETELKVLKEVTPEIPVLTNFMTVMTDVDYWKLAPKLDFVSFDNYPEPGDELGHVPASLNYGIMRSLGDREPWLLLESATSAVSWRPHNSPKIPGQNRTHSYQAVANGSDAVMYFQWRASSVGAERFHSAVVGHFGEESRTHLETKRIWKELANLSQITGSKVRSSVALLIDWESRWAMHGPETMPSDRLTWVEQIRLYQKVLFGLGIAVDAVHPESDVSEYDLVVGPSSFLISDSAAANLESYVSGGGTLVLGPFSSVVDLNNHVHPNGSPGPLARALGVQVEEFWPAAAASEISFKSKSSFENKEWSELIHAFGASIIATYGSGSLLGKPAVTQNSHGGGTAIYVSADLEFAGIEEVLIAALELASVSHRKNPSLYLESVTRTDGTSDYVFVINHGPESISFEITGRHEILLGEQSPSIQGTYDLPPLGVMIFETACADHSLKHHQVIEVK